MPVLASSGAVYAAWQARRPAAGAPWDDIDIDRLKWLVLMVLSSQPGQEQACARMEDLVFDDMDALPH